MEGKTHGSMQCTVSQMAMKSSHWQIFVLPQLFPVLELITSSDLIDELDSFMYQTVGHDVIHLQAECMGIPLHREYIKGQSIDQTLYYNTTEQDETEDLFRLLSHVKTAHPDIQAVSVGAILSTYQRTRVENVCSRLGLTCLSYLWQRDQKELLTEMIVSRLTAIVIKVAAIGLNRTHLGRTLGELQPTLLALVPQHILRPLMIE